MTQLSASHAIDEYGGMKALEDFSRDVGILSFDEPEPQGWASKRVFGERPRRNHRGCRPVSVHPAGGSSVAIRWRFSGVHATTGQLQAVADKLVHALGVRRMVSVERIPGTHEALMILTNDKPISYPNKQTVFPQITSAIVFHADAIGRGLRVDVQNRSVHVEDSK